MSNIEYTAVVAPSCPIGTPESAPTLTPAGISNCMLWRVEVRIPAGHQGVTGIALVDSGTFIVPYSPLAPSWFVGDNDLLQYPFGKQLGANVALYTYNTGIYVHTWQVRLIYTPNSAVDVDDTVIVTPDVADWLAEITDSV